MEGRVCISMFVFIPNFLTFLKATHVINFVNRSDPDDGLRAAGEWGENLGGLSLLKMGVCVAFEVCSYVCVHVLC